MERSAAGTPADSRSLDAPIGNARLNRGVQVGTVRRGNTRGRSELDAIIGNARLNRRILDGAIRHGNARGRSESGRDNRERPIKSQSSERRMAYRELPVGQRMSEDEEARPRQEAHEDIVSWEMASRISTRRII